MSSGNEAGSKVLLDNTELGLGLDMNGKHQVLAYADDVYFIGGDIKIIERNADVLLV